MDQSDAQLRARISRLVAAAPASSPPQLGLVPSARRPRRTRRLALTMGLATLLVSGLAALGLPSLGRVDLQSRLDAAGVPADAQIVALQAAADGTIITVVYRDREGEVHTIGGVDRAPTPRPGER